MSSIQIIIPLYYCDPALFIPIETCFSTLNAFYPNIEKIIIDDASPLDLPMHWDIAETNVVNRGYTATVNRGLLLSTADIIIVCNDDLTFYPGSLDRFFSLKDDVIASPADTASGDLGGIGCIFGMTRATFEKIGLLDEKYRNFFSDTDYVERAEKLGITIEKWRDIILEHPESSTFKVLGNKEELLSNDEATFLGRNIG